MLITLTKLGRNCQVVFYNTVNNNTQTFQEDSANIECNYNVLNDVVSVAIKGRTQATTTSIVDNDVLYINTGTGDILIKTYSEFLINYALLFLNAGGTGGGVNPTSTYIPYNNAGTFADSYLINDTNQNILKTIFNTFEQGIKLDFGANIYKLGDFINTNNSTHFIVSDAFKNISTNYNGNAYGIELDFQNDLFAFGDMHNVTNGNYLMIDNSASSIKTYSNNVQIGLSLDFANNYYSLGDLANNGNFIGIAEALNIIEISTGVNTGNYTSLILKDNISTIVTSYIGIERGLKLDLANRNYQLGDYFDGYLGLSVDLSNWLFKFGDINSSNLGTNLIIDDNNQKININSIAGKYNFSNVAAYTDNADALANGLIVGDIYRHDGLLESADQLRIVH
jgi:hypothetical protein